jgi:hypothetical protein
MGKSSFKFALGFNPAHSLVMQNHIILEHLHLGPDTPGPAPVDTATKKNDHA